MNDVVQINKNAQAREQASLWLVRLQDGLSPEQEVALQAWLDADREHKSQLLELASLWDDMAILTELAPLFDGYPNKCDKDSAAVDLAGHAGRASSWPVRSIAAGIIVCVGVFLAFTIANDKQQDAVIISAQQSHTQKASTTVAQTGINEEHYRTRLGQRSEVLLNDGSVATLNTDSHIVVRFGEHSRDIQLLKGEVHFDVYKDPSRPLSVFVSDKMVRAVGTAFSVRKSLSNRLVVAVDEGKVAVHPANNKIIELSTQEHSESSKPLRFLQAGDVLTIINDEPNVEQFDSDEMQDRLAWKQGMIVIDDESLDYVLAEFSRYSHKKIVLADRGMGDIRVAGYFRLGDVDALMVALKQNFGIGSVYHKKDDTFVLSKL